MKNYFTYIVLLLISTQLFSQQVIKGKVVDKDGITIPGVNILNEKTAASSVTDFDGNFAIKSEVGDLLKFSMLGYDTKTIKASSDMRIILETGGEQKLDEVVLVGFGTKKKGVVTGSVSQIKSEVIMQTPAKSAMQSIQGKAAGVSVVSNDEPGGNPTVTIRGLGTILGNDLNKIRNIGPFKYLKNHNLDAYVLGPQCPENEYWDSEVLYNLIQKIQKENNVDANRIYLTGLSMGAWAAWNLVYAHPNMFAAVVPIAGYVDRIPMVENCKIKNIPIRIFHGLLDDVVNVDYSIAIYKKLKTCNPDIELTIFDDANHDSWSRVYDNQKIYDWMFEQVKK